MKNLLLPAALFLAVSITPVAAGAAQDAPEPGSLLPLSIPSHYRVGDGLSFTTQDGRFLVNTGIMTQVAYTVYDYGDNDESRRETRVTEDLGLRRLFWWLKGHAFRPELTYFMQVDFADDNGVRLLDGYVNYRFLKEVQARGGRYIVPFSRQGNVSVGNLQFTDRSSATIAFSPDRDDGFSMEGNFLDGVVRYSAGVFSGAGPGGRRRIHARAYNARIEASNRRPGMPYSEADVENTRPPLVAVGASIYRNRLRKGVDERGRPVLESVRQPYAGAEGWVGRTFRLAGYDVVDEIDITQWQADAAFMWRGLFLQSEYFAGKAEGRRSGASVEGKGIYVQGGYFVIPDRLELAYRYSFVDPSREFRDDMTDHQGVVNWYFVDHNLKLQAEYTRRDVEYPPPLQTEKANIYRVQFQVKF